MENNATAQKLHNICRILILDLNIIDNEQKAGNHAEGGRVLNSYYVFF